MWEDLRRRHKHNVWDKLQIFPEVNFPFFLRVTVKQFSSTHAPRPDTFLSFGLVVSELQSNLDKKTTFGLRLKWSYSKVIFMLRGHMPEMVVS